MKCYLLQTFSAMSGSESDSGSTTESPTVVVSCSSTESDSSVAVASPAPAPRIPTPKELLQPKALRRRPKPEPYTSAPRVRTHYNWPDLQRKFPPDKKLLPGGPVVKEAGKPGPIQSFLIPVEVEQPVVAPSSAPKPSPPPKAAARLDAREGVLIRPSSASARPIPTAVDRGKGKGKGKK